MDPLAILGFLLFLFGLMLSIALHEIGHLVPAKLFGVKVTQYMVGFGSTMWSRRRGETEYGIKAVPLGGYVRMVGMLPPEPGADPNRLRDASTGPFQSMIDNARQGAAQEVAVEDTDRLFYRKPWWQKLIVMSGGPAMNLVLAVLLFGVVLIGFGQSLPTTTVGGVSECVIDVDRVTPGQPLPECSAADPRTPAAEAGIEPGDTILSIDGVAVESWEQGTELIRERGGQRVLIVVDRGGTARTLEATLVTSQRYGDPDDPCSDAEPVGFLGVSPEFETAQAGAGAVLEQVADFGARTVSAVLGIPERMVGVWNAAFGGEDRDVCSPVGIVGAGRIGGEIASADGASAGDRVAGFIALLASFNMAIAVFNLIPLLPLDGGHIAGALWEGLKRAFARVTGRPEPSPVDVAKALPLAYAAAIALVVMSVLVLYADIVNPVRLPG